MDNITPQLTISDAQQVRKLSHPEEFDLILTLGYYNGLGYDRPVASDTNDEYVFEDGEHDYERFEAATDRVCKALAAEQRVLVHCQAGVSRSAGVCAAALAVHENTSIDTALRRIRCARPRINPVDEVLASARKYVDEHQAVS